METVSPFINLLAINTISELNINEKVASSPKEKADCLDELFESVFTIDDSKCTMDNFDYYLVVIDGVYIPETGILHLLKGIDASKSCGPN